MKNKDKFEDFGASKEFGEHHFLVEIPQEKHKHVTIFEDFGFSHEPDEKEERAILDRRVWEYLCKSVANDFNTRLKVVECPKGKWHIGFVKVDRLLGKELCVLAWSLELINPTETDLVAKALLKWQAFHPEELWWLYMWTASQARMYKDHNMPWRRALRIIIGGM